MDEVETIQTNAAHTKNEEHVIIIIMIIVKKGAKNKIKIYKSENDI